MASTSSSSASNLGAIGRFPSNGDVEWQWCTDDLRWRPFNPGVSSFLEAARESGLSSVEIRLGHGSKPTHVVHFQFRPLKQVNLKTQHERPVRRRHVSSTTIWEWWDEERNHWQVYDSLLTSKFETAWHESISSQQKPDWSAGIIFERSSQHYSMLFEGDGIQYNLTTSFSRSVRRYTRHWNSSLAATVSDGQITSEESEHSYLVACANPKEGENCSVCLSSLQEDEAVELAKCHHIFHRECITQWFKTRPSCPECLTAYGVIMGTQPPGEMKIRYIPITSKEEAGNGLQGYLGTDIIEITYVFQNGVQTVEHPSPGSPYIGTRRVAYLPKNKEGEEVLELLKIAWSRRLLFTVGTSVTTGRSNTVVWAGIHHKTRKSGGSSNYGYPDETYFDRVKQELAHVNVV